MRQGDHRRQRRILIIDDNRSIHDDFRKILDRDKDGLELAEAEIAFFGEATVTTSGITYEIDDAFQGQEGLELVKPTPRGRPMTRYAPTGDKGIEIRSVK